MALDREDPDKPDRMSEADYAAYQAALEKTKKQAGTGWVEKQLQHNLAEEVTFDMPRERARKAKRIINMMTKAQPSPTSEAIFLPGLEPRPYEPLRLIRDDHGNIIQNWESTAAFKLADAKRARDQAQDIQASADFKTEEAHQFVIWSQEQMLARRPLEEIIFDNFLRETGRLGPPLPKAAE